VIIENVINRDPRARELGPAPSVDDLRFDHGSSPGSFSVNDAHCVILRRV
jgi:hypothetical protein